MDSVDETKPHDQPDRLAEIPLAGGNMNSVSRLGATVLRSTGPWTATLHRYLSHLIDSGLGDAVPKPLGFTPDGRERLSFLDGEVPQYPMPEYVWSDRALESAAELLRRIHDASLSFDQADAVWSWPVREPAEVICHGDFATYNLVFREGLVAGVIDFDTCAPGPRVWDLAYLAYRMVPLSRPEAGEPFTAKERAQRLDRLLAACGGGGITAAEVIACAVERLHVLAEFSEGKAVELGKPELAEHAGWYRLDAAALDGSG